MRTAHLFQAACGLAVLSASVAFAQTPFVVGSDVRPSAASGKIRTGGIDDASGTLIASVEHFGYQLGQSPDNPYFTADPGFNASAASGLPAGQPLRFDGVRRLAYWPGTGTVRFGPPPAGESLRLGFGAASATFTGSADATPGFAIGNVGSTGAIHRHLNATLQGNGAAPQPGVYFAAIRLSVGGGTVARSDAVYLAYGSGVPAAELSRGLAYLADPRPGDADFDNRVGFPDLLTLASNYNAPLTDAAWFQGDFTGDGVVNFPDLLVLASNYNTAAPDVAATAGEAFAAEWSRAVAAVPEPTAATIAVAATALLSRRRRR